MSTKKIPHLSDTSSLVGKNVRIYRNIKTNVWSIWCMDECRVIAHVDSIRLKDAVFHVSEKGRQRVIREKRKNVHAWVHGVVTNNPPTAVREEFRLSYNPYKSAYFMRKMADNIFQRVTHCRLVVLHSDGKVTGGIPL